MAPSFGNRAAHSSWQLTAGEAQAARYRPTMITDPIRLPATRVDAVNEALTEVVRDPNMRALAIVGSLARGDALPGSDIDK